MSTKFKAVLVVALALGGSAWLVFFISSHSLALFQPRGVIAREQLELMIKAVLLMLIVVLPVFVLTAWFAWRYRAGNTAAKYTPDPSRNTTVEIVMWAIPITVISVLALVTWPATHALDPHRPIDSAEKPLTIQVVALDWKWLFIYPEQNIATVNFVQFPERVPINFELTADAPMNSFWIPQLGGQMYAMAGMVNRLHLMADTPGEFAGVAAEINGRGLAGMTFTAKAATREDFDAWIASVKRTPDALSLAAYSELAKPSENAPVVYYSSFEPDLYNKIVAKFMAPLSDTVNQDHDMRSIPGMH